MGSLTPYDLSSQLSSRIITAARSVYQTLGPGRPEDTYRQAVANELRRQKLEVQRLFPVDVWQRDELAALYFLDLFVEWQVVVEVKASRRPILEVELVEMGEYLQAVSAPLGILLNFGGPRLSYERVFSSPPARRSKGYNYSEYD